MNDLLHNDAKIESHRRASNSNIIKKTLKKSSNTGIATPSFYDKKIGNKMTPSQRFKTLELNTQNIMHSKEQIIEEKRHILSNYDTVNSKIL